MRGKHDTLGSMGAGALTGALFKSTGESRGHRRSDLPLILLLEAGVRPAIAAATFMSGMAGLWSVVKKSV